MTEILTVKVKTPTKPLPGQESLNSSEAHKTASLGFGVPAGGSVFLRRVPESRSIQEHLNGVLDVLDSKIDKTLWKIVKYGELSYDPSRYGDSSSNTARPNRKIGT